MPAFLAWPLIKAFFSGTLGKLWAWLCHRSFWQLMFGAALILAGWEYLSKLSEQRRVHKVEAQLIKAVAGRKADRAAYEAAEKAATSANLAQVHRVEQQQQKVTDDVETGYRSDLARLRADNDRLRSHPAASGAPGKSGSSAPGPTSGGLGGQAVPLPDAELLQAQETELQLNALIDWVLQQSAIDPNK